MRVSTAALAGLTAIALAGFATIAAAEESVSCTTEPQSKWMSTDAVTAKLLKDGYKEVRSIKTEADSGTCYEIKAIDKDGKKVEGYVNPVTAELVKGEAGEN